MLQLFFGVTNSNKFSFEIWGFINLLRHVLSFSPFKVDQKVGNILSYTIKFHVAYVIKISADIRKIHNNKLIKCLTSIVIFQYHVLRQCKLEIHTIVRPSTFRYKCGCIHTSHKQESLQSELKITHKDFAILNSHVTVIYLRFIKITNFLWQKFKIAVFLAAICPCI